MLKATLIGNGKVTVQRTRRAKESEWQPNPGTILSMASIESNHSLDFRQVKTMTFDGHLWKKESPRDPFPYNFNKLHAKQCIEFHEEERQFTLPKNQENEEKRLKVS